MRLYIDPGTGSMLFSLVIGLISVIWFAMRKLYLKVKYRNPGKEKSDTAKKDIVLYSEDKRYWTSFKGILDEFERRKVPVTYLAGSEDDPNLTETYEYVEKAAIGLGNKAYRKLNFLSARILLATTPGLDVYQWKRSKDVDWYVHMTHSIGAATGYRMFGVEFFDAVLFASDFFTPRLREIEEKRGSDPKQIVAVGCTYMDYLLERKNGVSAPRHDCVSVLVAPSWGPNSLLNRYGDRLIDALIATNYHIVFRPHPQSYLSEKELIERLQAKYPDSERFQWNRSADNFEVLRSADVMISDFSGVIYDYAFIFQRPVLYTPVDIDVSVLDEAWVDAPYWGCELLPQLGRKFDDADFADLREIISDMLHNKKYADSIIAAREQYWQHRGNAANAVADYLIQKCNELKGAEK